jgi:hypothetical protein
MTKYIVAYSNLEYSPVTKSMLTYHEERPYDFIQDAKSVLERAQKTRPDAKLYVEVTHYDD